ncbi:unnamed protein product (macronuclear) [Paramecium tetraurelia]|uniref:FHA domain-containing protein n=1 Tax=Paramecium tetraurelia TaxID=5888 RepID=A0E0N3_PARTE|nr:uncharacterized protein GSPATT00022018001 [Paramecium tetraurelia]CAK88850.1 unnamed protein product [Paramecium tetraurelia]|eukprot:XP_001456247.1 hypothetical protein (macronuclear) [Paramecium tetraurelia strain d4-2]
MGNCVSSQDDIRNANKVSPVSLTIKHFTWNRDSHGLFDYENKNVIKGQIKANTQLMRLIRQKENIKIIQTKEELQQFQNQPDVIELLKLTRQFSKYQVESSLRVSKAEDQEGLNDNCPWIVVKSTKSQLSDGQGYDLREGDYVKLGRVRFRIREIKCSVDNNNTNKGNMEPELQKYVSEKCLNTMNINTQEDDKRSQSEEPCCRICYNDSQTNKDNPLIDCCKCQGSVKYIHIQCLQTWLVSKLSPKTTKFSVSFQWRQFDCEVCKAIIPSRIRYQDRIFETIIIPKPDAPYITLEILSRERNKSKGTHIISFAQKQQIKLGRGHDSDVRITDISVSRCHALIKFINSGFVIEDQQSKFGTLVLLKNPAQMSVDSNNNMAIQVGRSVVSFQVSKDWNIISSTNKGNVQEDQMLQDDTDLIGNAVGDEDQAQIEQELQNFEEHTP